MLFYELSIIMILQFISPQFNFPYQSVILSNMLFSAKKNLFFRRFFKYWTFLHSLPLILKNNYPPFIQNSSRNDSQWMKPLKPFSKHWWSFFKLKNYHSRKQCFGSISFWFGFGSGSGSGSEVTFDSVNRIFPIKCYARL